MRGIFRLAVLAAIGLCAAAQAQEYPTRPVHVLTPFAPGGGTELIGRLLCDQLTQTFGQAFILESKPGGGGNVAGEALAHAPPDGHTLLIASLGAISVNHLLYTGLNYDPAKDFAPISVLVKFPNVLEVISKLGPKTLPEFLAYAKAHPNALNHGSPGIATTPHLVAELFMMRMGFKSVHVPYRGAGPLTQGLTQGEVQWAFDSPQTVFPLFKSGTVVVLGIGGAKRDHRMPDVPTLAELGIQDSAWDTGFVLVAPTRTPRPIIDRLSAEVGRAFRTEATAQRLINGGLDPAPSTPKEAAQFVADGRKRWSDVVIAANIKVE